MDSLAKAGRLVAYGNTLRYLKYELDLPATELDNFWTDTGGESDKTYVVQTSRKVIERCILMTTDPGDLVVDITCGSGTTAYVAEQWGRRWITCDTSRVAIALAKQRLMTAIFDYYQLANPAEDVGSGFKYKTVPHISLKSIANNPEIKEGMKRVEIEAAIQKYADQETLYDQPIIDKSKVRVTGPFTVEAVPAPVVMSIDDVDELPQPADQSIARSGEYTVEVLGFDYYNNKTCNIESGGIENIAIWMLDTNYNGRSLFPKQVFFPMAEVNQPYVILSETNNLKEVNQPYVILSEAKNLKEVNQPYVILSEAKNLNRGQQHE